MRYLPFTDTPKLSLPCPASPPTSVRHARDASLHKPDQAVPKRTTGAPTYTPSGERCRCNQHAHPPSPPQHPHSRRASFIASVVAMASVSKKPKRPGNAFFIFRSAYVEDVKRRNTAGRPLNMALLTIQASDAWKSKTKEEKEEYFRTYAARLEEYQAALKAPETGGDDVHGSADRQPTFADEDFKPRLAETKAAGQDRDRGSHAKASTAVSAHTQQPVVDAPTPCKAMADTGRRSLPLPAPLRSIRRLRSHRSWRA
ncbi:hypothetical protein BD414DRAFT_478123 [Trametes punicea]|nr:hypothetical protein BD414DRAFT_478123 [Trametes punicea]